MKTFKIFSLLFLLVISACSTDDQAPGNLNEVDGLELAQTIENSAHQIELYTQDGTFKQGHNKIWLHIKETGNPNFITNAEISWLPVMNMMNTQHSAPFSEIQKTGNKETLYEGFLEFQMPGNESEFWELELNYSIGSETFSASEEIDVLPTEERTINSFEAKDGNRYIISLIEPQNPETAINKMKVGLYRMEDMMNFPVVDNFRIKIDPRMPGMDNHSSPNNTDLTQEGVGGFYIGDLSLTMSGYWVINLELLDESGEVIKGEEITEERESSSIFFEIDY